MWYVASDAGISVPGVRLDRDGKGVIYTQNAHVDGREYSGIVHQPFDGGQRSLTATEDAHHDALQLPDGRIAFLRECALYVDNRTIEKVWEFASETDQFLPLLGDARRLPGGNALVSWTLQGMLTELTPEGEVAWRASVDLGAGTTRVRWIPDLYDPL